MSFNSGLWFLGCAIALVGCAHPQTPSTSSPQQPLTLAPIERSEIKPDVSAITSDPNFRTHNGDSALKYRALSEEQCRVAASRFAPAVRQVSLPPGSQPDDEMASFARAANCSTAADTRNTAAGNALIVDYRLAEAEGRLDLLVLTIREVETTLADVESMRKQGIVPAPDPLPLRRQLSELHAKREQVRATRDNLNDQLRLMIGVARSEQFHLWPSEPLSVQAVRIDTDQAVAVGLASRNDLDLLRFIATHTQRRNVVIAAQVLAAGTTAAFSPPTGPIARVIWLHRYADEAAAKVRTAAVEALTAGEDKAALEIRTAAREVETQTRLTAHAAARLDIARERVDAVQRRQKAGLPVGLEAFQSRLEVLEAEANLLGEVAGWHVAWSRLRRTQGKLAW